jgi:prenyltransferase beta subunit
MNSRKAVLALLVVALWTTSFAARAAERTSGDAISDSLKWLAAQQRDDGGWAFDGQEMAASSSTEATGLVLLAFLEASQSHREGEYKEHVRRGLAYLTAQLKVDGVTGDLRGAHGDMIAHAVATCALVEAYAMTRDKELLAPAQRIVNFIAKSQDEKTGGWKRDAMASESMLAFGWHLLALKRAHMAYLDVPKASVLGAMKYLDGVQQNEGRFYAEHKGERERRATAIGLHARCMLGWKTTDDRFAAGVKFVGHEPQAHDALHNYFAHQLHFRVSPETWPHWRIAMLKQLVASQDVDGADAGSWFDAADVDAKRGRLQQTAINAMILSLFRRGPLPLAPKEDVEEEFPL